METVQQKGHGKWEGEDALNVMVASAKKRLFDKPKRSTLDDSFPSLPGIEIQKSNIAMPHSYMHNHITLLTQQNYKTMLIFSHKKSPNFGFPHYPFITRVTHPSPNLAPPLAIYIRLTNFLLNFQSLPFAQTQPQKTHLNILRFKI